MDLKQIKKAYKDQGGSKALANALLEISEELQENEQDVELFCDVRLRYYDGNLFLYHGSSDYDPDHRGYWGSSSVGTDYTLDDALGIADELFEQVLEDAAS